MLACAWFRESISNRAMSNYDEFHGECVARVDREWREERRIAKAAAESALPARDRALKQSDWKDRFAPVIAKAVSRVVTEALRHALAPLEKRLVDLQHAKGVLEFENAELRKQIDEMVLK